MIFDTRIYTRNGIMGCEGKEKERMGGKLASSQAQKRVMSCAGQLTIWKQGAVSFFSILHARYT